MLLHPCPSSSNSAATNISVYQGGGMTEWRRLWSLLHLPELASLGLGSGCSFSLADFLKIDDKLLTVRTCTLDPLPSKM
jgi:hypothetical protein